MVGTKTSIVVLVRTFLLAGLGGLFAMAMLLPGKNVSSRATVVPQSSSPESEHAQGEVLVKFKPDAKSAAVIEEVLSKPHFIFINKQTGQKVESPEKNVRSNPQNYERRNVTPTLLATTPVFQESTIAPVVQEKIRQRSGATFDGASSLRATELRGWQRIRVSGQADIATLVRTFRRRDDVVTAQANYVMTANTLPNDTYVDPQQQGTWSTGAWGQAYEDLWGLKKIEADVAWERTQGQDVVVAVIDTGLDYSHPDIVGNVWQNTNEGTGDINQDGCPGACVVDDDHDSLIDEDSASCGSNGRDANGEACTYLNDLDDDDDENGYVDDLRGWNFAYQNNNPTDMSGHGTHVAGTIAAVGNNAEGIIGVAPRAEIMPVKGLDDGGSGYSSSLANAILYAASNGADVINNSWGCRFCASNPIIEDAVRYADSLGSVLIFSAGNSTEDVAQSSPQNMTDPKPIVIAASTEIDTRAPFSNFGRTVDATAPGSGTYTIPTDPTARNILSLKASACTITAGMCRGTSYFVGTRYFRAAGTSMAAPHAAGVAALIRAFHPAFSNEEVRQALRASADDIATPNFDIDTGAGRINANRALTVNTVLGVRISSPIDRTHINQGAAGSVTVSGTASGVGFQSYTLSYGNGLRPSIFTSIITRTSPKTDEVLGGWAISALPDGIYTLLLTATSMEGFTFSDTIVVSLDRTSVQISFGPDQANRANISGNLIVWDSDYSDDIHLYDLGPDGQPNTADCYPGGTCEGRKDIVFETPDPYYKEPAISGNTIVWTVPGMLQMCAYNTTTGTCPVVDVTSINSTGFPAVIDGTRIAWGDDTDSDDWEIDLYDLGPDGRPDTGDCYPAGPKTPGNELSNILCEGRQRITTAAVPTNMNYWPDVSGKNIVWSGIPSGGEFQDLYLHNLDTTQTRRLTNANRIQILAKIEGNRLAWISGWNGTHPERSDVLTCLYDTVSGTCPPVAVATDNTKFYSVDLSGDSIVWQDDRLGTMDIYLHQLNTGRSQVLVGTEAYQDEPRLSGTRAVWIDNRTGPLEVFTRSLPVPTTRGGKQQLSQ